MADTSRVRVLNIKHTDLKPKLDNPALEIFLPKYYFAQRMELDIHNVSNAVSSALRKTLSTELLVKAMACKYDDIITTDIFIIPEMITKRISTIPLDQGCPLDMVFELKAVNATAVIRDVKTHELRIVHQGKQLTGHKPITHIPFNDNITLFTLHPGKSISITNIRVNQSYGYIYGDGMYAVAFNAVSLALDQSPINVYEDPNVGTPSSRANARQWHLAFNTNGTISPTAILAAACNNLINRVTLVGTLLKTIDTKDDEYILTINNESHTIGNLFMRTICDLYPGIIAVTYSVGGIERVCTIHVRCTEDISEVFTSAIREIVRIFKEIGKHFPSE